MTFDRLVSSALAAGLLSFLSLAACSSDDTSPPAAIAAGNGGASGASAAGGASGARAGGAGASGAGSNAKGGAGGAAGGLGGGSAGISGSGGGTGGAGGGIAGVGGATGGAAGAGGWSGGAAGAGGSTGGAAGGTGGSPAGAGGIGSGAGGVAGAGGGGVGPTTCRAVHGVKGCCSADGTMVYSSGGTGVVAGTCPAGTVCSWSDLGRYWCEPGPAKADPSGAIPMACGGLDAPVALTKCPAGCAGDDDCAGTPSTPACNPNAGFRGTCQACLTDAHCAATPGTPICLTSTHKCVGCITDAHCTGLTNTCEPVFHACEFRCKAKEDCTDPALPLCDYATGQCRKDGPTTCDGAHGAWGCCSADRKTYFYTDQGGDVVVQDCAEGSLCSWTNTTTVDGSFLYDCAAVVTAAADPSGTFSPVCGAPFVSRVVTGCPESCVGEADCAAVPGKPGCDLRSSLCVPCTTDAHCQGDAGGPACNGETHACVGCTENADCQGSPRGPACDIAASRCVCSAHADCAGSSLGAFCSPTTRACVACLGDFDCDDPTKPSCGGDGVCSANGQCPNDDAFEDADDGPLGATDITPGASDASTIAGHSICGIPETEADYFAFTAENADTFSVSLAWTDKKQKLGLRIVDAKGKLLGLDVYRDTPTIKLGYLPAGTYYVRVRRVGGLVGEAGTIPYTLQVARTRGTTCAGLADCAKDNATAVLRAVCSAATGACSFLDGKGAVPANGTCDSDDDCVTGHCGATLFNQNAASLAFCNVPCQTGKCPQGLTCSYIETNTTEGLELCTGPCTKDADCSVDFSQAPFSGDEPWSYATCADGACF